MAGQKTRAKKTSNGQHGAGGKLRQPFTDVQKVLLGGGMLRNITKNITQGSKGNHPSESE
jgi:hypothetical protein